MFLVKIVDIAFQICTWLVIISCILSFVTPFSENQFVRFFRGITDPVFAFIRRLFPFLVVGGAIDLSPIVVLVLLNILHPWVIKLLISIFI